MTLRFANGIFEPIWRREHIDYVEITAAETIGVEHRGAFYEPTGALRATWSPTISSSCSAWWP